MILKEISVANTGRFASPTTLGGLGAGLNVLAAQNEAGKSTILRALQVALRYKHSSKHRDVTRLQPHETGLPVHIRIRFEHEGETWDLRKQYMSSASALLLRGEKTVAEGEQAQDRIEAMLGLKGERDGAFGLLWVEQTKSFELPTFSGDVRTSLQDLVKDEISDVSGGKRTQKVLSEVKKELDTLITATGKAKANGDLAEAQDAVETAREALDVAMVKRTRLDADIKLLGEARQRIAVLDVPDAKARLEAGIFSARTELAAAQGARKELEAQAQILENARLKRDLDIRAHNEPETRLAGILALQKKLAEMEPRLIERRETLKRLEGEEETSRTDLAAAEQKLAEILIYRDKLTLVLEALQAEKDADRIGGNLASANADIAELRAIDAELKTLRPCVDAIDQARKHDANIQSQKGRLEAAAPRLSLKLLKDHGGRVRLDGAMVDADTSVPVTKSARVIVEGIAEIEIAASETSSAATNLQAAQTELAALLLSVGAQNIGDMQARVDRFNERKGAMTPLRTQIMSMVKNVDDPEEALASLAQAHADANAKLTAAKGRIDLKTLPPEDEVQSTLDALKLKIGGVEEDVATARAGFVARETPVSSLRTDLRIEEHDFNSENERLQAILKDTSEAELREVIANAAQQRDRAVLAFDEAQKAHAALAANVPDLETISVLEERLATAEGALEKHRTNLSQARQTEATLLGQVSAIGGDGLDETIAAVEEDLAGATRRLARVKDRVGALTLLRDAIQRRLAAAEERLTRPVLDALRPYLSDVFPSVAAELGAGLEFKSLQRDGLSEDISFLSDGTREQVAILTRLAIGHMLVGQGETPPIILDDALVFSDDIRLEAMFKAMTRASRLQQVLVFTCHERAFQGLGGNALRLEPCEKWW
jgi:hypothetical protein